MKVIVVNDGDGHTSVCSYTKENALIILRKIEEVGFLECEVPENVENLSLEKLDEFLMKQHYINQRGGQVHIVELENKFQSYISL